MSCSIWVTNDWPWSEWSRVGACNRHRNAALLVINDVVYAELLGALPFWPARLTICSRASLRPRSLAMPRGALFLAAKVFQRIPGRRRPANRRPPDFFIGAHASFDGLPLLTRVILGQASSQLFPPKSNLLLPGAAPL